MKSVSECYRGAALVAFCLLGACHVVSSESTAGGGDEGNGEGGSLATAGGEPRGGTSAVGGEHAGGVSAAGASLGGAAGQAGGDEAGDAASGTAGSSDGGASPQSAPLDPATAECDVDGGGCVPKCVQQSATCAVERFQYACEFEQFHDMPVAMTCGQTVTVGTADCGQCGSVPVKLYYDGSYCWQGVPDCVGSVTFGELIDPHAPLP